MVFHEVTGVQVVGAGRGHHLAHGGPVQRWVAGTSLRWVMAPTLVRGTHTWPTNRPVTRQAAHSARNRSASAPGSVVGCSQAKLRQT